MRYDLTDLRLFLNIGLTSNLTRAAEKTFLSLPAASSRIKNLEEALKVRLLTRQATGVKMTRAGEVLLRYAQTIFNELDMLHAELAPFSQGIKGKLKCLFNTTSTHSYVVEALSKFLKVNKEVDIEIEEKLTNEIVTSLRNGSADLGIVSGEVDLSGLESTLLFKDELVLLTNINHELANQEVVDFSNIVDFYPFVGIGPDSTLNLFLNNKLSMFGKRMHQRVFVSSFDAVARMVEVDVGIAVVPRECIRSFEDKHQLKVVSLSNEWASRERYLCRLSGRDLPSYTEDFIKTLLETAKSYNKVI